RACQRQPLLLAAGEPVAPGADHCAVPVREADDQIVDLRVPGGLLELAVRGVRTGVAQVLGDGVVQQVRLLGDHTDQCGDIGQSQVAQVCAVDTDRPGVHVVQAGEQCGHS